MRFIFLIFCPIATLLAEPISTQEWAADSEADRINACCFWSCPPFVDQESNHWICAISAYDDSLGIEDGSIWQLDRYDSYLVNRWMANDPIVITQNRDWFSSDQYRIFNQNLGESIAANLSFGPIIDGNDSRSATQLLTKIMQVIHRIHWFILNIMAD